MKNDLDTGWNERWLLLIHKEKPHSHKTKYLICQLRLHLPFIGRKRSKIAHYVHLENSATLKTIKMLNKSEKLILLSQFLRDIYWAIVYGWRTGRCF